MLFIASNHSVEEKQSRSFYQYFENQYTTNIRFKIRRVIV